MNKKGLICFLKYFLLTLFLSILTEEKVLAADYEVSLSKGHNYVSVSSCPNSENKKLVSGDGTTYYGCVYRTLGGSGSTSGAKCLSGYEAVPHTSSDSNYTIYLCRKPKYEYVAKFDTNKEYTNVVSNGCPEGPGLVGRKLVSFTNYSRQRYACVYARNINSNTQTPSITCPNGESAVALEAKKEGQSSYNYTVYACQKASSGDGSGGSGSGAGSGSGNGGSGAGSQGSDTGSDKEQGGGTIVPNVDPDWHYTPSTPSQNYDSACSIEGTRKAVLLIGKAITLATYIIPLIIIVLGMIDFGKAVTSNDEKAQSKATGTLIRRIVAGIVVFLIPTLLKALINVINVNSLIYDKDNYDECLNCIMYPFNDCAPSQSESNSDD